SSFMERKSACASSSGCLTPSTTNDTCAQSPCIFSRSFLFASSVEAWAPARRKSASTKTTLRIISRERQTICHDLRSGGLLLGQRHADDLFLIAREDAALGKRRMRPDHLPAARFLNRLQNARAIN